MRLRADFSLPESVAFDSSGWIASPAGGVDRFMLDRIGDEVARATSLVRYAPGSRFPTHAHELGEEFIVLNGVFSDESGDFAQGAYVRNPPGTSHAPWTDDGCVIFVKLRQFDPHDLNPVSVKIAVDASGKSRQVLHSFQSEVVDAVALSRSQGTMTWTAPHGGVEIFLLAGHPTVNEKACSPWHWLRFPEGALIAIEGDCQFFRKQGHLATPPV